MSFPVTFKPGDAVVIAVIVVIAWVWTSSGAGEGGSAENLRIVTGNTEDTLSLSMDTVVRRGEVTIEIAGGRAAITGSDCPTRQCVRTGWLHVPGQMSACMPNRVFIEVLGESSSTDAVTY